MFFNSYIFVLLFLPICILGYFSLNHFGRTMPAQIFLLCLSLWFYAYFNLKYLLIILASITCNYMFYLLLNKGENQNRRKMLLFIALA